MQAFANLLDRLSYEPRRNGKLALMEAYFSATPDPERGFALAALTDELYFQNAKPGIIREGVVVKPVREGSSFGVVIVREDMAHPPQILTSSEWRYGDVVMVERYVAGRELTCGAFGDTVYGVIEIVPGPWPSLTATAVRPGTAVRAPSHMPVSPDRKTEGTSRAAAQRLLMVNSDASSPFSRSRRAPVKVCASGFVFEPLWLW